MNIKNVVIVFSLLYKGIVCEDDYEDLPNIEISTGFLEAGYRSLSFKGTTFTAFEGIPYARPPVGELRFQPPEEPYNWTGIWKANTKYSCIPFMKGGFYSNFLDSEDCLYLNVYVPSYEPNAENNFDVVVHLHSGAFTVGHPHFASGPKFLLDEDHIIFVTLNYRLGPLGFLSTEDEIIPGNNGLKDQVLALKWIQKNIKYFGGNPDSVTITGSFSGGASVHYHYLSSLSKDLFHRGYSGSGTALDPWALQDAPLVKAKRLAVLLGCNPVTSQDILNCVMQRSTQAIVEATQNFFEKGMPFSPFGPVIEVEHKNAFLSKHPYQLLKDGPIQDLPWIVVLNKDEGIFPAGPYYQNIKNIDEDWVTFAPHLLDYNYTISYDKRNEISKKVKEFYFGDKSVSFKKLVKACSHRHFFMGAELSEIFLIRAYLTYQ
nr:venom carboxylesterase-6-like [Onthophagus taurus]